MSHGTSRAEIHNELIHIIIFIYFETLLREGVAKWRHNMGAYSRQNK